MCLLVDLVICTGEKAHASVGVILRVPLGLEGKVG